MPEKHKANRGKHKNVLRLPDLDHSKASVLQSLGSVASKRTYAVAINDFIAWYCSEPRLAFGRTVVLRYRYELEARRLAPFTFKDEQFEVIGVFNYFDLPKSALTRTLLVKRALEVNLFFHHPP